MNGTGLLGVILPLLEFEVRLEVVVLGVLAGLGFGLLGVGLTIVYKTTRVINFAHGDIGAFTAAVFLVLTLNEGWAYLPALAVALALSVVLGVVLEYVVVRRFESAPRLVVMVGTLAASQLLLGMGLFLPRDGFGARTFPTPFTAEVNVGLLRLHAGELMILALTPLIVGGLAALFRRSRIGLGARAASENLEAARLAGAPARRISRAMWVVAALLSTASAFLVGPMQGLTTSQSLGPSLMVRALAAAALGGFSSIPQVMAGGVVIGVVERLVSWNYPASGELELLLLGIIVVTMLVRRDLGQRTRGGEASSWSLGGSIRALEPRLAAMSRVRAARSIGLAVVLALAVLAPIGQPSSRQVLLSSIVLFAVMGLSIVVLTGFAGQVSLAQYTFVGVGALVGARLSQLGYPPWVGAVYATSAGGLLAVVVGVPALRIRGLFLAVTTLAFAVAAASWLPGQEWLVDPGAASAGALPRRQLFGIDLASERNYYWLCLGLLVASCWMVSRLRVTGVGRRLFAVRDNESAASAVAVPPRRTKLTAFALAGMLAALAGYFYGGLLVSFSPGTLFAPAISLNLLLMVILGGVTTVTGAVVGALWTQGIPYLLDDRWAILSTGVGVLLVLQVAPGGIAELLFRARDRAVARLTGEDVGRLQTSDRAAGTSRRPLPSSAAVGDVDIAVAAAPVPIRAEQVRVEFGGLVALDDVSLEATRGEIVGLVGPNGAGKTTMFDVLAGHVRPQAGRVFLEGGDVTRLAPHHRALLGLGRSFQDARLFAELPLVDAFKVALEQGEASEIVPSLLGFPSSRDGELAKDLRAWELVDLLGLGPFASRNCGELSTGSRRFAELGMLLAMRSRVLLLDEPTAGIAQREVEQFTPVLREVRDHLDATIVVIDHDIPMMIGLVDRLYVMNAGVVIAEGDPRLLRDDPAVVAAYLGTDERAVARSGTRGRGRARRAEPLRAGSPR